MSNILDPQKKKWLSNFILLSFLTLVGVTAFLSNAFKTPVKTHTEFIEQSLVFNNKELDKVIGLSLKNKSGEFLFERPNTIEGSPWHMSAPKSLSISSAFIEKFFSSLRTIKTKKLLIDDKVNNSNFSLEKPTAILTLTDETGKNILISIGIMNTIDNTTYIKISGKAGIYHVEAPSVSLENITITDLIKSTVFDFDLKTIVGFKIQKKKLLTATFEVSKDNNIWKNADGKKINSEKLENIVNEFKNVKSSFTIDTQSDPQKKVTSSLLSSGDFVVKITKNNGEVMIYQISSTTKNIPDLTLNDEEHFIITENHKPFVYVIKKEFMNLFELKNEKLKSLEQ